MSVLPSFKATFSSYTDGDGSARFTDDLAASTLTPSTTAPGAGGPFSASCQDRQRHSTYLTKPLQHTNSTATYTPRSPPQLPNTSASIVPAPVPSFSPSSQQPHVPPLPLEMVTNGNEPNDAPDFGFAARHTSKRSTLDPLPIEVLGFPVSENPYIQTSSLKRSSVNSSQAPTQKRCRSQYLCADSSALKNSFDRVSLPPVSMAKSICSSGLGRIQSATPSLTPSFPPPSTSNSSRRALPKLAHPKTPSSASPVAPTPAQPSPVSEGVLPPISEKVVPSSVPPEDPGKRAAMREPRPTSMAIPPSGNRTSRLRPVPSSLTRSYGDREIAGKRKVDGLLRQPTLSLSRPGIERDGTLSVFRLASFSTNGGNSDERRNDRARTIRGMGTSSRVHAVEVVEDSTGRAPVDVLSIPGERSLPSVSALSARNMQLAGIGPSGTGSTSAGGGIMSLPPGPTASEFSHLMRAGRKRVTGIAGGTHTPSDLVDGTERLISVPEAEVQGDSGAANIPNDDRRTRASIGSLINEVGHVQVMCQGQMRRNGIRDEYNTTKLHPPNHIGNHMLARNRTIGSGETTTTTRVAATQQKTDMRNIVEDVRPVAMTSNSADLKINGSLRRLDGPVLYTEKVSMFQKSEMKQDAEVIVTADTDDEEKLNGEYGANGSIGQDDEFVQCPNCPRRLRNQVTLQNHIRVVHDNNGNFRCTFAQCGLTFMWRSTLNNHVRLVHEKQRPYACDECGKGFRWNSHLREHVWVVHKGEKPFQCEICYKTFGRKNNMQKHMRKHSPAAAPNITDES